MYLGSSSEMQHRISVIVPVFNEESVVATACDRIQSVREQLAIRGCDLDIVFVNDGSSDSSRSILERLVTEYPNVHVLHLSRNFGHQPAVCAGLEYASGSAVVVLDADLQDPPELIPEMVDRWLDGNDVVYAVRKKRKESCFKVACYWMFYRVYRMMSDIDVPLDSGDFSLMSRRAVDLLNKLPERQRFVRGLRTWIGLKQCGVAYERAERFAGDSTYSLSALFRLATDGLISFSAFPLRMVTRLGMLSILMSIALAVWILTATFYAALGGDEPPPRGWASLACLVLFMSAVQLLSLGVIGEYISRLFIEVKGRPTYVIETVSSQSSDERDSSA